LLKVVRVPRSRKGFYSQFVGATISSASPAGTPVSVLFASSSGEKLVNEYCVTRFYAFLLHLFISFFYNLYANLDIAGVNNA
jgi:hypothetical protein